jgi:hypothetical protein
MASAGVATGRGGKEAVVEKPTFSQGHYGAKIPPLFYSLLPFFLVLAIVGPAWGSSAVDTSARRMPTLEEVKRQIEENGYSWVAGHTPVSDLSYGEFRRLCSARIPTDYESRLRIVQRKGPSYPRMDLPSRFDWTDSAAVSPVRDQECGDCWAQAAVAAIESQMRIHDGDTTLLSVQQAIDCNFYQASCSGGWHTSVYQLYQAVGAVSQSCYPYVGIDQACAADTCDLLLTLGSWEFIDTTLVSLKTHLMTNGPLAVWMQTWPDIADYTGGCYEHEPGPIELGHLVLIVGWDDSLCGGVGAWHVKNSWGTDWGEDGYFWIKYWTGYVGALAAIVHYTPREPAKLVYDSHTIDDTAGDNDGKPDPGETVTLPVTLRNKRWETATGVSATILTATPGVQVLTDSAVFPSIPGSATEQSESPHFSFSVDSTMCCGPRIHFVISIACDQGDFAGDFDMLVGESGVVFLDDVEAAGGWALAAGDDDATSGAWMQTDPKGSLLGESTLVQTELDHTPGGGFNAFTTQNAKRDKPPDHRDVDGGKTTLLSPVVDLTDQASALLRYWRWYTNETGVTVDDYWVVDVSPDSGATWISLENDGSGERAWVPMEFDLGGFIPLSDGVMIRFVASDYGGESTVEAAVDDIEITGCPWWVDVDAPTAEIAWPNGGEELLENSEVEVHWTGDADYGIREFIVVASYDGGLTFDDTLGVAGGFDTTLAWQVPAGEHPECKIGIEATDRGYNKVFDESDSAFSIIFDLSGVEEEGSSDFAAELEILGCRENPFTGSTHIFFALPQPALVTINVYDAGGRLVEELLNAATDAGYHSAIWNGRTRSGTQAAPGVYFVRLEAGGRADVVKLILAR